MVEEKFKAGEKVVMEGEEGHKVFFVEKGEAKATKMIGRRE